MICSNCTDGTPWFCFDPKNCETSLRKKAGVTVKHDEYGKGIILSSDEPYLAPLPPETHVRVLFDVLPECHWGFAHIHYSHVPVSDLVVV